MCDDLPHDLLLNLIDAAKKNDTASCASLLGHRKLASKGLNCSLLKCSASARKIQRRLFPLHQEKECTTYSPDNFENLVEALMLSPSAYETPYIVACEVLEVGSSLGFSTISAILVHIQTFLRREITSWLDRDRKLVQNSRIARSVQPLGGESLAKRSPKFWILKLVKIISGVFNYQLPESAECDGVYEEVESADDWTAPLKLLPLLISYTRQIDFSVHEDIFDAVFSDSCRSDRLLVWIHLASDHRLHLRDREWDRIEGAVESTLEMQQFSVHFRQAAELSKFILSFCSFFCATSSQVRLLRWQILLLRLLSEVAHDVQLYFSVEAEIETGLLLLQSSNLRKLSVSFSSSSFETPSFVLVNVLLLFIRACQLSGLKLVGDILSNTAIKEAQGLVFPVCWNKIVLLLSPKRIRHMKTENNQNMSNAVFDGAKYIGGGVFKKSELPITELCASGEIVFQSLHLFGQANTFGSDMEYISKSMTYRNWLGAVEQALDLIVASKERLHCMAVAVVIVVLFCEISASRKFIIEILLNTLSADNVRIPLEQSVQELQSLFACDIITVILESQAFGLLVRTEECDLKNLVAIFDQELRLPVFTHIITTIFPLPAARKVMFDRAKRILDTCSATVRFSRCGFPSTNEAKEKLSFLSLEKKFEEDEASIKRSLVIMCNLICLKNGEDSGGWDVLQQIIVSNRPVLPASVRGWLSVLLRSIVRKNQINQEYRCRLQAACVLRFWKFCLEAIDTGSGGRLKVSSALDGWSDSMGLAGMRSILVEDLPKLLQLILTMADEYSVRDKKHNAFLVEFWRKNFWTMLHVMQNDCTQDRLFTLRATDFGGPGDLMTDASMRCIALALNAILNININVVFSGLNFSEAATELDFRLRKQTDVLSETTGMFACKAEGHIDSKLHPEVSQIELALFDQILRFLLGRKDVDGELNGETSTPATYHCSLCDLLVSRQRIAAGIPSGQESCWVYCPDAECVCDMIDGFLRVCAPSIPSLFETEEDMFAAERIFRIIPDLCSQAVSACEEASPMETKDCHRMLRIVWNLYCIISKEDKAKNLITFFERHRCLNEAAKIKAVTPPEWLEALQCSADVDCAVQDMRRSVLEPLRLCLIALCSSGKSDLSGTLDVHLVIEYLMSVVVGCSDDLLVGLRGESGGVTTDMFSLFIDCIRYAAESIGRIPLFFLDKQEMLKACYVCKASTQAIWKLLKEYSVCTAALFTKSASQCFYHLPAVCRKIKRASFLKWGTCVYEFDETASLLEAFHSCHKALLKNTASDNLIVSEPPTLGSGSSDDIDFDPRHTEKDCDKRWLELQLDSELVCGQTFCCIFDSLEWTWAEYQDLLDSTSNDWLGHSQFAVYCPQQISARQLAFWLVSLLFSSEYLDPNDAHKVAHACALSPQAKLRLVFLLDRIVSVQLESLKILGAMDIDMLESKLNGCFVEAFCCSVPWLTFEAKVGMSDILTGTRSWILSENRVSIKSNHPEKGFFQTKNVFLQRLSKLASRLDTLETELNHLKQLGLSFQTINKLFDAERKEFVREKKDEGTSIFDLTLLIAEKLDVLERGRLELEGITLIDEHRRKKHKESKEIHVNLRKECRRKILRSRNQTVDLWLQQDREAGEDEANGDTFADLEDFLVDG
jgi:hypothetical protein